MIWYQWHSKTNSTTCIEEEKSYCSESNFWNITHVSTFNHTKKISLCGNHGRHMNMMNGLLKLTGDWRSCDRLDFHTVIKTTRSGRHIWEVLRIWLWGLRFLTSSGSRARWTRNPANSNLNIHSSKYRVITDVRQMELWYRWYMYIYIMCILGISTWACLWDRHP